MSDRHCCMTCNANLSELKENNMTEEKRTELMNSEEFDNAILEGAELKKTILTTYKQQNKTEFDRFYETMVDARLDIQDILDKKKKNRTDDDNNKLKQFKQDMSKTYKLVCDYLIPETVEEGRQTKVQKLVDKIASAIDILRYIVDDNVLDAEFDKRGISIATGMRLEDKYDYFTRPEIKQNMADIFACASRLKKQMQDDNESIATNIYTQRVPAELQFDKEVNNDGLKPGDFKKLVDLKTKQIMASTDEAKAKVEETIENAASDKQFEVVRAQMMRDKITAL